MNQFKLFPPPSPEVKAPTNPFRRSRSRKLTAKTEPVVSIPADEVKDPVKAESVLLQIIEDTRTIPAPPEAHVARSKSQSVTGVSPVSNSPQSSRSPSRHGNKPSRETSPSQGSLSNSSARSKPTTSSTSPQSSHNSTSPVPMRSMFPHFDPKLPRDKQNYHPQMSSGTPSTKAFRKPSNLALPPNSEIDKTLGPKTVPASALHFPIGLLESDEIQYSSSQELGILWETANGQRPQALSGAFNLRMTRTGHTTFTFGNPRQPFYTLQTRSADELSITRGDPSKPNSDVPIMMLKLEDRSRRAQPEDGLVTLLFSKLAAMLAIEQAKEISNQHHRSPSEAAEVENNALKCAAAQESCRLSWNRQQRLYELRHPSLSKRCPPALIGAAGIPLSPVRSQSSGVLHITISAPVSDASPRQPPTIIVTGALSPTAVEAAQQAASPRTSTLPLMDTDEPLAALDFATKTLSISPAAVIATIPSLYAIDSLIAAMLAVAVSDEATSPILADMELGSPCSWEPSSLQASSTRAMPFHGHLVTTIAEREDAAESLRLASQIQSAKSKSERAPRKKTFLQFWGRTRSTPQDDSGTVKKNRQIVVEEFDLERYGRYGPSSSREGQKLPGITRALLRALFWGLDMVVKGLTLAVRVLAWVLVNSTRCVTSEKF